MRRKIHSNIKDRFNTISFILIFQFLLITIITSTIVSSSEEKQLLIDVLGEVPEEEDFLVSVYTLEEGYLTGVEIEFDNEIYSITMEIENGEISIPAPQVIKDSYFTITATKNGYLTGNKVITIQNILSKLIINLDEFTVNTNEWFSLKVTDEKGKSLSGVTVGIQSVIGDEFEDTTNDDGRARLLAPKDKDKIIVKAQKIGYTDASTELWINAEPGLLETIQKNPVTPILIAVVLLILAIVLVNYRQKRLVKYRAKEISKKQTIQRYSPYGAVVSQPISRSNTNPGSTTNDTIIIKREPKIEEIRISRPRKDKTIVEVEDIKEDGEEKAQHNSKNRYEYDWFKGTDNVRYEIDRITGNIDEDGIDKWIECTDDLRVKINEKIKKKDKKKIKNG